MDRRTPLPPPEVRLEPRSSSWVSRVLPLLRRPRWLTWKAGVLLGAPSALAVGPLFLLLGWMHDGAELARAHARHQVSHPGWSFPARLYSAPVPLDAPPSRLLAEAGERGYSEDCGAPRPGTFCPRSGTVVPRRGSSLEPVLLGWVVGPDAELREHLPISEAPNHLLDAIVVAEDRDFWSHRGVNLKAVLRAAVVNLRGGSYAQGGSTLSMQVVRNLTQRREKTLWRKLRELGLAMGLERELGKEGVLQMYLDAPYLGQEGSLSVCGFAAAARHYFGKEARDLTLAESAMLASILPAPAKLSPRADPELARARMQALLRAMADRLGYQVDEALAQTVSPIEPEPLPERHPAYLSAARAWLLARLAPEVLYGAGLSIETGIDLPAQAETERLFSKKLEQFESVLPRRGARLQAAALALDVRTGMIRAIFGGTDGTPTGFNRATQARRQPASSFKPLVYALAFTQRKPDGSLRFTASSTEPNSPREFRTERGRWRPRNVGGEYGETASLAYALIWSQNVATASLLEQLGGPRPLIDFAARMGFDTSGFPEELGLALGQAEVTLLEMTQFAALVANGGERVPAAPVWRAVDAAGAERVGPPSGAREAVLDRDSAVLTRELMRLVIDQGTGGAVRGKGGEAGYRGPAIGKTGTTDGQKDLWFVGSTPSIAGSVWIGYDRPIPIDASASDLAAPLWGWWMSRLARHDPALPDFPGEPRLVRRAICAESGGQPNGTCRVIVAPFLPGSPSPAPCRIDHSVVEGGERPARRSLWERLADERGAREGGVD